MLPIIFEWLNAGQTPLLAIIALIVWRIKTNDLPHILERVASIEGRMQAPKQSPKKRKLRRRK